MTEPMRIKFKKERKNIMEKITRSIDTKKATLQTATQDFIVAGSCKNDKQILKAVEKQLGENEIAVTVKEVATESHKYEMPLDQFIELATLAD